MNVVGTRSSNSMTGVYKVNTFKICWHKQTMTDALATHHVYRLRRLNIYWWWTCAVVRAVHMVQIAWASASVFFLVCRSCAACTRGSRVSFAPQHARSFSASHSSNCQTLYLKPEATDKQFRLNQGTVSQPDSCSVKPEYGGCWQRKQFTAIVAVNQI